jgi:ferredoxin
MAVLITDTCISCDACLDECPTEAIVDNDENPTGEDVYFVDASKCVECVDHHDEPACAEACPTEGCIVWAEGGDVKSENRGNNGEPVIEE